MASSPDGPYAAERIVGHLVPDDERGSTWRRVAVWLAAVLIAVGLCAAWRWTELRTWLDVERLASAVDPIRSSPAAPVIVVAAFVVASLLLVPITLLIAASIVVFGPWLGGTYALIGAELGALATYGIGAWLGRDGLGRLAGSRIDRISRRLGANGLLAVIVFRVIPVGPFSLVNAIAGASHIRLRDFAAGTALGMLPGVIALGLVADRAAAALDAPSPLTIAMLVAALAAVGLVVMLVRRWLA